MATMKASAGRTLSRYERDCEVRRWESDREFMAQYDSLVFDPARSVRLPDFSGQVAKGAAFLDETTPDWWKSIDTSALDLRNENMCILGQSWSHYQNADLLRSVPAVGSPTGDSNFKRFMNVLFGTSDRARAAEYGFNLTTLQGQMLNYQAWRKGVIGHELFSLAFEALTAEWLKIIRSRQEAVALLDTEQVYARAVARGLSHGAALLEVVKAAQV